MSVVARNGFANVLHVRSWSPYAFGPDQPVPVGPFPHIREMDALLASFSSRVTVCNDVYRGLADLCELDKPTPRAVIVCVDGLGPTEMAFFSIVHRLPNSPDVHVYGDGRFAGRITRAIQAGAKGEANEIVIERLLGEATQPTMDEELSEKPDAVNATDSHAGEAPALSMAADEVAPRPARVPWQQYDAIPNRQQPGTGPITHQEDISYAADAADDEGASIHDASESSSAAGNDHRPLLTLDELGALLHDDASRSAVNDATSTEPLPDVPSWGENA